MFYNPVYSTLSRRDSYITLAIWADMESGVSSAIASVQFLLFYLWPSLQVLSCPRLWDFSIFKWEIKDTKEGQMFDQFHFSCFLIYVCPKLSHHSLFTLFLAKETQFWTLSLALESFLCSRPQYFQHSTALIIEETADLGPGPTSCWQAFMRFCYSWC